jgi:hypothetical protein
LANASFPPPFKPSSRLVSARVSFMLINYLEYAAAIRPERESAGQHIPRLTFSGHEPGF